MSDLSDERKGRLDERLRALRARRTRPDVVSDVERLTGRTPTLDDFLSAEATARLTRRYLAASSAQSVERRTWSADLVAEVRQAAAELAASLAGMHAFWLHRLADTTGAVRVPAEALLAHAAAGFSPGDYDVVLLSDNADDGVRLAWDVLPDRAEFEIVCWGAYRRAG